MNKINLKRANKQLKKPANKKKTKERIYFSLSVVLSIAPSCPFAQTKSSPFLCLHALTILCVSLSVWLTGP